MIIFTAPDDTKVSINPASVVSFYPNNGNFHRDAKTVIELAGGHQAVKEDFETVKDALK